MLQIKLDKKCTWIIAYINKDFTYRADQDIKKFCTAMGSKIPKPELLKAYIPTVRILKKQFKGREIFEEVPFLFNYGFFQIPNTHLEVDFLLQMKEHILCIHQWVKDSRGVMSSVQKEPTDTETRGKGDVLPFAVASVDELARLVEAHKKYSVYDRYDVDNLIPGTVIRLKGYPFDEIDAKILKVDKEKELVKVELLGVDGLIKRSSVSFSNVLYTIYHGTFDENDFKERSIEEIGNKGKNYVDKLYNKNQDGPESE